MHIKKLHIKNYRSCITTKVSLDSNLTALIGINGAGKSNILSALLLFQKIKRSRFRYRTNHNFATKRLITEDKLETELELELDLNFGQFLLKAKFFYETDEENSDELYYTEIKYKNITDGTRNRKWNSIEPHFFEDIEFFDESVLDSFEKKGYEEYNIFQLISGVTHIKYYSATHFSNPSLCPVSVEFDENRNLPKSYFDRKPHHKFIRDLYEAWDSKSLDFQSFIQIVGKDGLRLVDNITFHKLTPPSGSYKIRVGGKFELLENQKLIIVPSVLIDGLKLSLNQLSEGTFKTLALIFYILSEKTETLIIEEPEVCIHHGLLMSVVELIVQESRNKQIIISTHSDYILDLLTPENIVLVRKDRETGTQAQVLEKHLSSNDFEVLKQYLKNSGNLGEYWKEGGFEYD